MRLVTTAATVAVAALHFYRVGVAGSTSPDRTSSCDGARLAAWTAGTSALSRMHDACAALVDAAAHAGAADPLTCGVVVKGLEGGLAVTANAALTLRHHIDQCDVTLTNGSTVVVRGCGGRRGVVWSSCARMVGTLPVLTLISALKCFAATFSAFVLGFFSLYCVGTLSALGVALTLEG